MDVIYFWGIHLQRKKYLFKSGDRAAKRANFLNKLYEEEIVKNFV